MTADWEKVAMGLKLPYKTKRRIAKENPKESNECLQDVLYEWLKKAYNVQKYGPPSWRFLAKAIASSTGGDNLALAKTIARNHPGKLGKNILDGKETVLEL